MAKAQEYCVPPIPSGAKRRRTTQNPTTIAVGARVVPERNTAGDVRLLGGTRPSSP